MVIFCNKRGQVAVFVILAIVIVGGIIIYAAINGGFGFRSTNPDLEQVFTRYSECIQTETENAISIAQSQGGRIDAGEYVPGSEYAPFSNQLNFLGVPVPYWYYLSANGVVRQNVPTRADIQNEIATYIEENVNNCNFDDIYAKGYYVNLSTPDARVSIGSTSVSVDVRSRITAYNDNSSAFRENYDIAVDSKLGKFYDLAIKIYNKQLKEAFLENYSLDVLNNYAPVDGVEISCSPRIWNNRETVNSLLEALEANSQAIKLDGNYYTLNNDANKYFVVPIQTDEAVRFIYSKDWPTKVEINGEGVQQEISVATPVGNQPGLGVMGFCYQPYHFVYDVYYPMMVQIYDESEIFQFPVSVIIENNLARQQVYSEIGVQTDVDFCEYYTQDIEVRTYDSSLNSVNANLSYNCFNQECVLGETQNGAFMGKAPSCLNGYIVARSNGYADSVQLLSTSSERRADVILDKNYNVSVNVLSLGRNIGNISNIFVSLTKHNGSSAFVNIPDISTAQLSEGQYDLKVYVFSNSSIVLPKSTTTQCTKVSNTGVLGLFGGTSEKCINVEIPETKIEYALIGGGVGTEYFTSSSLSGGEININIGEISRPRTLAQLQTNYESFEREVVYVTY